MAQILVRGLEEDLVLRIKGQAAAHGRSLESEVRAILESAAGFTASEARDVLKGWQSQLAGRQMVDSAQLLREDRER